MGMRMGKEEDCLWGISKIWKILSLSGIRERLLVKLIN